jgi:dTDP-4-dehydrorhamnose 3,5-epimerase-like enzyme
VPATRDEPGPDHHPKLQKLTKIDGVVLATSPSVTYGEENRLTELARLEWSGVFLPGEPIEHLYTVHAPEGGTRKEWYYHEHTTDRYMVQLGQINVGLFDGRESSPTCRGFEIVSLGAPGSTFPNMLRIPPGIWHSFYWNSKSGLLLNAKTPPYSRSVPDKFRIRPEDYPPEIVWNT